MDLGGDERFRADGDRINCNCIDQDGNDRCQAEHDYAEHLGNDVTVASTAAATMAKARILPGPRSSIWKVSSSDPPTLRFFAPSAAPVRSRTIRSGARERWGFDFAGAGENAVRLYTLGSLERRIFALLVAKFDRSRSRNCSGSNIASLLGFGGLGEFAVLIALGDTCRSDGDPLEFLCVSVEFQGIAERLKKSASNGPGPNGPSSSSGSSSKAEEQRLKVALQSEFNRRASKIGLGIHQTSQKLAKLAKYLHSFAIPGMRAVSPVTRLVIQLWL
ncbi:hypothetical protein NL676_033984 [Syzygium grande]|nr:hypothetical protein NL676_033984 [Syzygium grande]